VTAPDSPGRVVIVGGGLSGLGAAVGLTSRGIHTLLLEQKPALGGRAYSFTDPTTGDTIDNGQHMLIAGYDRTLEFLGTIGTLDLLAIQPRPALLFHHPEKGFHWFRLPKLPSPFHLLWGVITFTLLSVSDRIRMLRAGLAIRRAEGKRMELLRGKTIEQWLDSVAQTAECKRSFWEPLAVSIMNEHIGQASAYLFVRSLRKAFFSGWQNSALAIPRVGLSELYVDGAREYIAQHGGTIRCGADVVAVLFDGVSVTGVQLRDGEMVDCRAVILAVPPNKAATLLPDKLLQDSSYAAIRNIAPSPIISIHLWFDGEVMDHEFVGLIGRTVQWVFNKKKIGGETHERGHVSAVISAAYDAVSCTNDELVGIALNDLRSAYPRLTREPTHAVVIREKRATFPVGPATEHLRVGQKTPVVNLFLAGDWTNTDYPATIEAALMSADRCVELVLNCIFSRKS